MKTLVLILDLCGTFVFALSGATAAVRRRLDLFGVLVLSFAAANSGGIVRDLLIGAVPPAAIGDWRYLAASLAAGLITFGWAPQIEKLQNPVRMFDAAGLALFAVAGAQKALASGLNPVMAALLGMLTGIGGGMARDVLLADVPMVLRADLYAVAALAGATVVVVGSTLALPSMATTMAGALLCFGLRTIAIRRGWQLPVAGGSRDATKTPGKDRGSDRAG
ncbi:trimeric intracellular cation channel family protein [Dokdonella soli]|uniref:trimeric intracellular cation channel family protein n=1 Tax=Dokdonella soli TaxID=529810 RepID=UPI0031DD7C50